MYQHEEVLSFPYYHPKNKILFQVQAVKMLLTLWVLQKRAAERTETPCGEFSVHH